MAVMAYFLWNRKALLSRGIYDPVVSSDTLDGSELSSQAYHIKRSRNDRTGPNVKTVIAKRTARSHG